jgi:hypothetical protein
MRFARFLAFVTVAVAVAAAPARAAQGHDAGGDGSSQSAASRQERLTSAQSYLPMTTLQVTILQHYSISAMLVVEMGIDVQDAALRDHANLNKPRLQDALRTALSTYANVYYHDDTAPDPTVLTRLLQQSVDRVLGKPGAQVLLSNIIYQRHVAS